MRFEKARFPRLHVRLIHDLENGRFANITSLAKILEKNCNHDRVVVWRVVLGQKSPRTSLDLESGRGVLFSYSFLALNHRFPSPRISRPQAPIGKTRPEQPHPAGPLEKISKKSSSRDTNQQFQKKRSQKRTVWMLRRGESSVLISLRTWAPPGTSTLGDWGSRAERLDRSLDAYTPIPSTPSSMGALVQSEHAVASMPSGPEWLPIFGRGFRLRCFQPLSSIAWLPGSALSDNR